jgi:hypothetical protein
MSLPTLFLSRFRRRAALICCVLALVSFDMTLWQAANAAPPNQKVNVDGYYLPEGKLPPAFANIDNLSLFTTDVRGGKTVDVPVWGFIRLKQKTNSDYRLVSPTLEGKRFTFSTKTLRGVSYQFAGDFTKIGNFVENPPEGDIVLKGHLTKMQSGKKVAETDVSFRYTAGD